MKKFIVFFFLEFYEENFRNRTIIYIHARYVKRIRSAVQCSLRILVSLRLRQQKLQEMCSFMFIYSKKKLFDSI